MKTSILLKNILFSSIVSLITIFLLDLFIQLLFPIPKKGYGAWVAYPGSELLLVSKPDDFQAIHRINKFGFRGADFPIEPRSDVRIIAVGDSYTEGIGAQEDETWPAVLAKNLSEKHWEVINLGKGGSQLARYAEIIANVAIPLKPTDMVVAVNPGDFRYGADIPSDLLVHTEFDNPFKDHRKPFIKPFVSVLPGWTYLLDRARGRWPIQKGMRWGAYNTKMKESAVEELAMRRHISPLKARRLVEQYERMVAPAVLEASKNRLFNSGFIRIELIEPYFMYLHRSEDLHVDAEDLKQSAHVWIKWYAETCEKYGIRCWLLYFPVAPLVTEGPWGTFSDRYYEDVPKIIGDTSIAKLIEEACDQYGVRFIDATPVLRGHNDEKLYHRWDTHPTARAYELVGNLMAAEMTPTISEARSSEQ